jgi:hypothetical protein
MAPLNQLLFSTSACMAGNLSPMSGGTLPCSKFLECHQRRQIPQGGRKLAAEAVLVQKEVLQAGDAADACWDGAP